MVLTIARVFSVVGNMQVVVQVVPVGTVTCSITFCGIDYIGYERSGGSTIEKLECTAYPVSLLSSILHSTPLFSIQLPILELTPLSCLCSHPMVHLIAVLVDRILSKASIPPYFPIYYIP